MALARLAVLLGCLWVAQGQLDASIPEALTSDDACETSGEGSEACQLGMLQKRKSAEAQEAETSADEEEFVDDGEEGVGLSDEEVEQQALSLAETEVEDWAAGFEAEANATEAARQPLALPVIFGGRRSVPGIEACHGGNTGYCNSLMYRARGYCPGSSCVQIVNPPGHRTRTPLHIHSYHFNGHGASLKRRMEKAVCGKGGWHRGGFPCGGRAKFFRGYPGVFSAAGGGISHACITVWPGSCHGGTIVLVSYGCSIEHSISQR